MLLSRYITLVKCHLPCLLPYDCLTVLNDGLLLGGELGVTSPEQSVLLALPDGASQTQAGAVEATDGVQLGYGEGLNGRWSHVLIGEALEGHDEGAVV